VVHGNEEAVLVSSQAEEAGAEDGAFLEIERPDGGVDREPPGFFDRALPQPGEVDHGQLETAGREDDLGGLGAGDLKDGAQRFVAALDLAQGAGEGRDVERAAQVYLGRDVVDGGGGIELGQEPEALLGEGERGRAVRDRNEGRLGLPSPLGAEAALDRRGQAGDGGGLEEGADGDLDAEGVAQARGDAGGEEGVAAEVEEALLDADALDAEDFVPGGGDGLLRRGARLGAGCAQRSSLPLAFSGKAGKTTKAAGTRASGRRSRRKRRRAGMSRLSRAIR
jgi:hypothetical protein